MKEPIVLKADVPLDSNTNRSELLWIIACSWNPWLLWAIARKNTPALMPPFFMEQIKDQIWEISGSGNQTCILYLYIVIFFTYFILQAV